MGSLQDVAKPRAVEVKPVKESQLNLDAWHFVLLGPMKLGGVASQVLSRSYFGETAADIGAVPHAYFADGCVRMDLHAS
eukprot:5706937-Amphidinium_carterae.3